MAPALRAGQIGLRSCNKSPLAATMGIAPLPRQHPLQRHKNATVNRAPKKIGVPKESYGQWPIP